jgi:hypothetical protein
LAAVVKSKWQTVLTKGAESEISSSRRAHRPTGKIRPSEFAARAEDLTNWLETVDKPPAPWSIRRRVAARIVLFGFEHWTHLTDVDPELLAKEMNLAEIALMTRAIREATRRRVITDERATASSSGGGPILSDVICRSADEASTYTSVESMVNTETFMEKHFTEMGAEGVGATLLPKGAIEALANARKRGHDIAGPLTDPVIKGARKMHVMTSGGALPASHLLTSNLVRQIIVCADSLGCYLFGTAVVVGWQFLLRMSAECLPLQAGIAMEATDLAPQRHSAVYTDRADNLLIRLQRRKHRPLGSLMKRPCICEEQGRQFCPSHRVKQLLAHREPGEELWAVST